MFIELTVRKPRPGWPMDQRQGGKNACCVSNSEQRWRIEPSSSRASRSTADSSKLSKALARRHNSVRWQRAAPAQTCCTSASQATSSSGGSRGQAGKPDGSSRASWQRTSAQPLLSSPGCADCFCMPRSCAASSQASVSSQRRCKPQVLSNRWSQYPLPGPTPWDKGAARRGLPGRARRTGLCRHPPPAGL